MSDVKNITGHAGIEKLKELVLAADMCMFATQMETHPVQARPMSTRDVDPDGTIWFFSRASSNKNAEIKKDGRVQLFYSNPGSSEFLNVAGTASIIRDKKKAKDLWSVWAKTWFPDGYTDPELTLIKVVPELVHYWDTKNNRMVSLLKIVAGAVTGKQMDDGIEGEIKVKSSGAAKTLAKNVQSKERVAKKAEKPENRSKEVSKPAMSKSNNRSASAKTASAAGKSNPVKAKRK